MLSFVIFIFRLNYKPTLHHGCSKISLALLSWGGNHGPHEEVSEVTGILQTRTGGVCGHKLGSVERVFLRTGRWTKLGQSWPAVGVPVLHSQRPGQADQSLGSLKAPPQWPHPDPAASIHHPQGPSGGGGDGGPAGVRGLADPAGQGRDPTSPAGKRRERAPGETKAASPRGRAHARAASPPL